MADVTSLHTKGRTTAVPTPVRSGCWPKPSSTCGHGLIRWPGRCAGSNCSASRTRTCLPAPVDPTTSTLSSGRSSARSPGCDDRHPVESPHMPSRWCDVHEGGARCRVPLSFPQSVRTAAGSCVFEGAFPWRRGMLTTAVTTTVVGLRFSLLRMPTRSPGAGCCPVIGCHSVPGVGGRCSITR
mgnify:CR=1 FL=1